MRLATGCRRARRTRRVLGYLTLLVLAGCKFQSDDNADQVASQPFDGDMHSERALEDYELHERREAGCEPEVLPPGLLMRPAAWDAITCTLRAECPKVAGCEATTRFLCRYPKVEHTCEDDSDCAGLPAASCVRHEERCFGFGVPCGEFDRFCTSPSLRASCLSDVECNAAPGGRCERVITSTRCSSDGCAVEADCGAGFLCACGRSSDRWFRACVRANCLSDRDCASGQVCASTNWVEDTPRRHTCNSGEPAQFCTTAQDECGEGRPCLRGTSGPALATKDFACGYNTQRERFLCVECGWVIP